MNIRIRKAKINELEEIQELACRTIDLNYRLFLGDKGVDWFIESGASDKYIYDNIADCWVIEQENKIIGFCVCKGALIDLMMVKTELHSKGYGSALLKYCENIMLGIYDEIRIESFERNEKANNFYAKNGWVKKEKIFDKTSNAHKLVFIKNAKRL